MTRWPNGSVTQPPVASAFGRRTSPIPGASVNHLGVDLTGCNPVRAIAAGRVVVVGTPSGWSNGGKQVWIQHDGYFSKSMHMGSFNVRVGDQVSEGQILGAQDTTGTATGSHLHLEITLGNVHYSNVGQVDPVPFIRARLSGNTAGSGGNGDTAQLQLDLNTLNYPLDVDGDYGPATVAAVTQFQKDNALSVDGVAGPQTYGKILELVKALQGDLVKLGYPLTQDGASGPQTVGAVKDFQSKNGLAIDGMVGPQTRAALNAKLSQPSGHNAIPDVRSTADIQRALKLAEIDGVYGPATAAAVGAFQGANGLAVDYVYGPATDAKLFPPTSTGYIPIPATGAWDEALVRAEQASLGFTGADIDGDRGKKTITAQQVATGMPLAEQDGVDGPTTTRYLQASLGVRQDGQMGPLTFEALRALLNSARKLIPGTVDPVEAPTPHAKPAAPEFPLASRWDWSVNSSPRTGRIQVLVGHHMGIWPAPEAQTMWDTFMAPNGRSVSPNLQINADGTGWEPVPPTSNRAWTTGQLDMQATTFEMMNGTGPTATPAWGFTLPALEMAAQYLAWNHVQFGVPLQRGKVTGTQDAPVVEIPGFVGHNETPSGRASGTTCPGALPYESIIARAKVIVAGPGPVDPEPTPMTREVEVKWLENLEAELLASAAAVREQIELIPA